MRWYKVYIVKTMRQGVSVRFTSYFGFLQSHKKCYVSVIVLITLAFLLQVYTHQSFTNEKILLQLTEATETSSYLSETTTYQHQPSSVKENDNYSCAIVCGKQKYSTGRAPHKNELVNLISLILQSHTLIYCPVPKVATKTILTAMLYMHVHDIIEHLNHNWITIDATRTRTEQTTSIPAFIDDLR